MDISLKVGTGEQKRLFSTLPHLLVNRDSARLAISDTFKYSFASDSKGFAGVQTPRPKYS